MSDQPFWTVAGLTGRVGVSAVTLRRWERTGRVPRWALILIGLLAGNLEAIDPAFAGWLIRAGELVTPEGWRFTPGEIRSIPFLYGQVRIWRSEALELRNTPQQHQLPLGDAPDENAYPNCRAVIRARRSA